MQRPKGLPALLEFANAGGTNKLRPAARRLDGAEVPATALGFRALGAMQRIVERAAFGIDDDEQLLLATELRDHGPCVACR